MAETSIAAQAKKNVVNNNSIFRETLKKERKAFRLRYKVQRLWRAYSSYVDWSIHILHHGVRRVANSDLALRLCAAKSSDAQPTCAEKNSC